jgi:hypothetical protein
LRVVKIGSHAAFWALVLGVVIFTDGIILAETGEDAQWTIDFGDISISEAFDQLTQITGIKIFTTRPLAHKISPKRYINQSIDQILKDLLKNLNYATVWHYGKRGIESIGILAFDREGGKSPSELPSAEGTDTTISSSIPKSPGVRQLRPRTLVSSPEKTLIRGVSQKPVPGSSAEPADEEGSEAEEREEESISSPTEANETPGPGSSDFQVDSTPGSSNEKEGLPAPQQNEDKESGSSTSPEKEDGEKG